MYIILHVIRPIEPLACCLNYVVTDGRKKVLARNLYVADTRNHTVRKVVVSTGEVTTLAGAAGLSGSIDGTGIAVRFTEPAGVAADGAGTLYVADTRNHTIRKVGVATGKVTTLAGSLVISGSTDGQGTAAHFNYPEAVAADEADNAYVVDSDTIRQVVLATGEVTTLAGSPGMTGNTDGIRAAARFYYPKGAAADGAGNLYVADSGNRTIRKVVVSTGQVMTLAGSPGMQGSSDGIGSAAQFWFPYSLALDEAGNLYVGDFPCTIRKVVVATGEVTTLAGSPGMQGSVDGTGAAARFSGPAGLAADGAGNLYVADLFNKVIRKIVLATGEVTTLAGSPGMQGRTDGPGAAARFGAPYGVAADGAGTLYVADTLNSTLRKIALTNGVVTTLVGIAGQQGVQLGPLPAGLTGPLAVTVSSKGEPILIDEHAVLAVR